MLLLIMSRVFVTLPKMFFGLFKNFGGLDIPRYDQNGVFGLVVGLMERADIVKAPCLDVVHETDRRPMVGMVHVGTVKEAKVEIPHRVIIGSPPALFGNDVALRLEFVVFEVEILHQFGKEEKEISRDFRCWI